MNAGDSDRVLVSGINLTKTFYNPQKREISQEKVQVKLADGIEYLEYIPKLALPLSVRLSLFHW